MVILNAHGESWRFLVGKIVKTQSHKFKNFGQFDGRRHRRYVWKTCRTKRSVTALATLDRLAPREA
jgi:hypothetical protein